MIFCVTFQKSGVNLYNTFMKEFKEVLISKARRDFFDQLCTGTIGLTLDILSGLKLRVCN